MKIYKAHYMPENTLYQILGKAEWDIREAYTGGAVDVYINHNGKDGSYFKDYVEKMYGLRMQYDKSNPMNLIAKLLAPALRG